MIVDDQAAKNAFARLCPPDVCPELGVEEVFQILDEQRRASLWTASTAYELGAVVIPTLANRNGHRFRLLRYSTTGTDQKSGATEPTWPESSTVTDNHVVWEEDGYDYGAVLWDIIAAARDGWLLKASKASPSSDVQTDALSIKSSQLFDHCMKMSAQFRPAYVL